MDAATLRALQAPLKQNYRDNPHAAKVLARAEVTLDPARFAVRLNTALPRMAGLHPATGGAGAEACSADMLLESLAACAGVTLLAVATAMGCRLSGGRVLAEGVWDARGTLGTDKSVPVGVRDITLTFDLEGEISEPTRQRLLQLTERYCVILATLREPALIRMVTAASPQPSA